MPNITKQGILNSNSFTEAFQSIYDTNLYVEPDNSVWIKICHHNNPASVRFSSSNDFTKAFYTDADRWWNMPIVNFITNGQYEFMIKSMYTTGSTEYKFRWIQTVNPYNAVFANVSSANVTKITTSGYSNYNWGGLYKIGSNTYFCTNNGTNGNWWGAVGAWNSHQGGIPGWISVITTGYQDVYLRVDNQSASLCSFFDTHVQAPEFIEW